MGEDDIIEILWKSGQGFRNTTPSSLPPYILGGSGSGGAEENPQPTAPMHNQNLFIQEDEIVSWLHSSYSQPLYSSSPPPPPLPPLPPSILPGSGSGLQPTAPMHNQNLFIQEDEMMSWPHSSYPQPLYSSTPQSSISLTPPPIAPYDQSVTARRPENFMNFSWLRGTLNTDAGRVEAGQSVPLIRESIQVGTSATFSSSATELCVIPPTTEGTTSRAWPNFSVPSLGRKGKEVAIETTGTPSCGVCKAETEPIQTQPATQTEIAYKSKPKGREETVAEIKGTKEAHGSTSRKNSRAAELHKLTERKRRQKMNQVMKSLKELIPHCNKSTKDIILDDAVDYVKKLQNQIQIIWKMQQFMPHMYMPMGIMGMNQPPFTPFPGQHHISGLRPPYPASTVHLPTPWPHFPVHQFVGLHQMQQRPPPLQRQTTSQPSFRQASSSKKLEDQNNQPEG